MIPFLWALPWLLLPLWALGVVRPRPLRPRRTRRSVRLPLVSLIVPARDEEHSLPACLESLQASRYPGLEIIVVDDGSTDRTADVACAAARADPRIRLVRGEPLPPGWFGKPWACAQGERAARGSVLAFVDADMRVHPDLLARSVATLHRERAALLSVIPRQELGSVWERLIMPHFLLLFVLRFPDPDRVNRSPRTRDKVALGGWIVARRDAYRLVGGHATVRHEVAEDLRLAQRFHAAGYLPLLASGDELLAVRMYRSLGAIVEGWSKNLAISSRQTGSGPLARGIPWLLLLGLVGVWMIPPAALLLGSAGVWQAASVAWGAWATLGLLAFGGLVCRRLGMHLGYAALLPAGAAVAALIVLRSIVRGQRVRWKGRDYRTAELQAAA